MKKKVIMIDDVAHADSIVDIDDDDDGGCRRFMVNAINEHTSVMSEETDVPVICLDDDDDEDDVMIDKEYKLLLDHLSADNNLSTLFGDDNGESETRELDMFSGEPKRSKLGNEKPINNRVSQQRKKRKIIGFEAEISRAVPLVTIRESIQRDNRVAERRKRKIAELEAARVSSTVPLVRNQENIQRDNKGRRMSESKVETLRDVPLVRTQEVIQRDTRVRRFGDLEVETLRAAPLVRTEEDIQRDNKARKMSDSKVETLIDVPLVRTQEVIQRDNKVRKFVELEVETLGAAPLVRTEEDIQRDNRTAERRKKKIDETKAAGTSRVVPVERVNRVPELKAVNEASRIVQVTQRNKGGFVGRRKKNEEECLAVVDKDYMSYLTWLVDSLKDSTTKPMASLHKDPSDFDPPISESLKESTVVPENDLLVKVKGEPDLESWSDDSDIIAVSDSPFLDGEGTPFVASKSVIDLDKEDDSSCCWFTKELMVVLKKPYDEEKLEELRHDAQVKRPVTRCRELRKGRERSYKSDELGPSYLESFTDFNEEYKRVEGDDKAELELLRGFFFYLENICRDGAFQPWLPENKKKLG